MLRTAPRRAGLALALYTGVALALTWPLAAHFTTHVTGDGIDDPSLAWNLWWIATRLVEQLNPDIFHVGWMFHPIEINLAFYTLTPLNGILSIPLQGAFSLVVANNLLLLASFVLGGFGAYLLALDTLRLAGGAVDDDHHLRYLAALLAGGVYAFAAAKLFYASLGQFNIASSQWIPFCVLYLVRMVQRPSLRGGLRDGLLAGLFLVFQAWSELTYASFLLLFVALLFAWRLTAGRHLLPHAPTPRGQLARLLLPFVAVGTLTLAGLLPLFWAMLPDLAAEGDFFASGGGFADLFSADLAGYLLPTRLHPLFGAWVAAMPFPNDKGQHIFLGYLGLGLAIFGLWQLARRPATRPWAWLWGGALLLFWLLTLGPHLRWMGEALPIPGPFALVSRLPLFSGNRYPSRYSVMLLLAVAVLLAVGVHWLLARGHRPGAAQRPTLRVPAVGGLLAAILLFEQLAVPLPLSDLRVPPIFDRLRAGDGVLLELPTGWRNGARVLGKADVLIMQQQWYQSVHGQRRLGGNTSRTPPYKFQYFSEAPLLGDLIALMNADRPHIGAVLEEELDALIVRDAALAPQVLDFLDIDQVLVYVDHAPAQLLRFVEEALPLTLAESWQGPDWLGRASTIRRYEVDAQAATTQTQVLDLAGPLATLYLGEGWSPAAAPDGARLATRATPVLLLDLPATGSVLHLNGHWPAGEFRASVNGQAVAVAATGGVSSTLQIAVPPGIASEPVDRLLLHLPGPPQEPSALYPAPSAAGWPIGTTGVALSATTGLLVRSAGEETGDFAQIVVDGRDVAANARGYNLAALATDGQLLAQVTFDTHADAAASEAMADWLAQWPDGTIIAGAVADEASNQLSQAAVDALARTGVATDLRGRFRWSHAFVGVRGAAHGTAVEATSLLQPATIAVGAPVGGTPVYGGVRRVVVE